MSDLLRLSPLLQVDRNQRYLSDLRSRISDVEEAAATGLAISRPSDAPHAWAEIFQLQDGIQDQSVYHNNAEKTRSLLEAVDFALGSSGALIDEAQALAVTYSSDILGQDERDNAAMRVDGMLAQVIDQANANFAGRYVFAGTAYDSMAFDPTTLTYAGSTDVPSTAVADGIYATSGFVGTDAFSSSLTVLTDLADALRTGTSQDVANQLASLKVARQDLSTVRQQAGYAWLDADDAVSVAENLDILLTDRLSDMVGADPFETLAELANLQTTFQTSLQVTATSGKSGNLFAFLR